MTRTRAYACLSLLGAAAFGIGLCLAAPQPAAGFCGFYVAGADAKLYNDATTVVMMRDGQRTVLAMQNDYQGPPEDFALVIPVPAVLHEGDVRTLPNAVFDRVDKLSAPRLVEYWEQDPCAVPEPDESEIAANNGILKSRRADVEGVTVEAQFEVGEYQIVILSAEDSTGLSTWLHSNQYNVPATAEQLLRPYVADGSKFFVAKVDASKVKFTTQPDGSKRVKLSPLRFHYDAKTFSLPLRLGLINAKGPQDLLVHILAPKQRYQAANYPNVTIPTNLVVEEQTRGHFGEFYVSLFDHTLARAPTAVVTEYAWSAGSCDPCPEPPLDLGELATLGADVLPSYADTLKSGGSAQAQLDQIQVPQEFVLTRLHARYDASSLGEDLVFEAAPALVGGRGMPDRQGVLPAEIERGGGHSSFQARYAILHPWAGGVSCEQPERGLWGGPQDGEPREPALARELAFVPRDANLGSYVSTAAREALGIAAAPTPAPALAPTLHAEQSTQTRPTPDAKRPELEQRGCTCSADQDSDPLALLLPLAGLLWLRRKDPSCPS